MVPVLVLLTFAAFLLLHRFVFSRGYLELSTGWPPQLELSPRPAAQPVVPPDVFLQPTFTWSRLGEWGTLCLGVHPMLLRLVGTSGELELRRAGERIAKGEALVRVRQGGRRLAVRSPFAGTLVRVNRRARRDAGAWSEGPWLYRLRPAEAPEAPGLCGETALAWTRDRYQELRAFLLSAAAEGHLGPVMADGGELPAGILAETDDDTWAGLERRFLAAAGPRAV